VPHRRLRIAFVGQLIPRKRVDLLFQALQHVAPLDYELTIIRDGPLRKRLQQQSLTLGRETSITCTGAQPMRDVRDALRTFDRVILPSDHDGWGTVITEALIAGTPAICSDRCGASEAILTTDMGAIFRHGDAHGLRRQLESAIEQRPVTQPVRRHVQRLAHAFTAVAGAHYLDALLASAEGVGSTVPPRWSSVLDDAGPACPQIHKANDS
jgi:glycosyltransferase involved in cell wall biosynthesis